MDKFKEAELLAKGEDMEIVCISLTEEGLTYLVRRSRLNALVVCTLLNLKAVGTSV